eukprot:g6272.t1
MGSGASALCELDAEQLAQLAVDEKVANSKMVAEAIRDNDIDGKTAVEALDDATVESLVEKPVAKKQLLAAFHKIPSAGSDLEDASKWVPDGYDEHSLLVIFGVDEYSQQSHDTASLADLKSAVADGKLMKETLVPFGFKIFEYEDRRTKRPAKAELYNEAVTKEAIDTVLNSLAKQYHSDTPVAGRLYIMFAGHGVPDPTDPTNDKASLFCCHDFERGDEMSTAYPLVEIKNRIKRIGIKHQLLHFDCCHAGGIFSGLRAGGTKFQVETDANKPSVMGMTAVTADEEAMETAGPGGNGIFTKIICDTLAKGKICERNRTQFCTISEVFEYARLEVSEQARDSGTRQTPMHMDILREHLGEQCVGNMLFFSKHAAPAVVRQSSGGNGGVTRGAAASPAAAPAKPTSLAEIAAAVGESTEYLAEMDDEDFEEVVKDLEVPPAKKKRVRDERNAKCAEVRQAAEARREREEAAKREEAEKRAALSGTPVFVELNGRLILGRIGEFSADGENAGNHHVVFCDGDTGWYDLATTRHTLLQSPTLRSLGEAALGKDFSKVCQLIKEAPKEACGALWNLAPDQANRDPIREAGGIPLIIGAFKEAPKEACGALWNLAAGNPANKDAIREAGGIPLIIGAMDGADAKVQTEACGALKNLANDNPANKEAIREAGGMERLRSAAKLGGEAKESADKCIASMEGEGKQDGEGGDDDNQSKIMSVPLSEDLQSKYNVRSMPIRKDDEVEVVRGTYKNIAGKVTSVWCKRYVIHVEHSVWRKSTCEKANVELDPSNVVITRLKLDEDRRALLERKSRDANKEKGKFTQEDVSMAQVD